MDARIDQLNIVITRLKKNIQTTEAILTSQNSTLADLVELRDGLMDCKIIEPAAPVQSLYERLVVINNTTPTTGLMRRIVDEIVKSSINAVEAMKDAKILQSILDSIGSIIAAVADINDRLNIIESKVSRVFTEIEPALPLTPLDVLLNGYHAPPIYTSGVGHVVDDLIIYCLSQCSELSFIGDDMLHAAHGYGRCVIKPSTVRLLYGYLQQLANEGNLKWHSENGGYYSVPKESKFRNKEEQNEQGSTPKDAS